MKPTTINELGNVFLQTLFRHHFGCEQSEHHPVLSLTSSDLSTSIPIDRAGELFVADVLKRFHQDYSFQEVDHIGEVAS